MPGSAGMTLSYELRPDGIRPGPKDAWDRFDRVVARLGTAMEGTSASAVAGAYRELAGAMHELAEAIKNRPARAQAHRHFRNAWRCGTRHCGEPLFSAHPKRESRRSRAHS